MVEFDGHSSAAKMCVIGKADDSIVLTPSQLLRAHSILGTPCSPLSKALRVGEGTVCPTRDGNIGHTFEIKIAANCCPTCMNLFKLPAYPDEATLESI